jgi:hypothetical protein
MDARWRAARWWPALLVPAMAAPAAAAEIEWPSCVDGSPPFRASADAARALLDEGDRERFERAARARYPLYRHGRQAPAQVVMLQRGGHWQYLTLWPGGPRGRLCLAAAFAADRFDFTPAWLSKYRPRAGDPGD